MSDPEDECSGPCQRADLTRRLAEAEAIMKRLSDVWRQPGKLIRLSQIEVLAHDAEALLRSEVAPLRGADPPLARRGKG